MRASEGLLCGLGQVGVEVMRGTWTVMMRMCHYPCPCVIASFSPSHTSCVSGHGSWVLVGAMFPVVSLSVMEEGPTCIWHQGQVVGQLA